MEILILSIYAGIAWTVFKVFKVEVNKWSLTTTFLVGFVIISSAVLLMNYNHPYTSNARVYFITTPVITNVSSQVTSVKVGPGASVIKGDTLFTMDSTIFVSRVKYLEATMRLARTRLNQSRQLASARAGSKFDVETYEAQVEQIWTELLEARWKVNQCIVTAKTNGEVAHLRLKEGMRSVEFPLRPVMTIVDTERQYIIGAFAQNPIQRLDTGNVAEVIFDAIPGEIFRGKVIKIGSAVAQGELQAQGTLHDFDSKQYQGSIPIWIELTDDTNDYFIPGGAKAQMAVYSEHAEPVKIIRMMLMRMKGWLNFVFGEH